MGRSLVPKYANLRPKISAYMEGMLISQLDDRLPDFMDDDNLLNVLDHHEITDAIMVYEGVTRGNCTLNIAAWLVERVCLRRISINSVDREFSA